MDESVKRKERLKAMRVEASQAEASNAAVVANSSLPGGCLSNPFVKTSDNMSGKEDSLFAPRFDFYTDPMAAFSGNRRSNAGYRPLGGYFTPPSPSGSHMIQFPSSPPGTWNPEMTPTPPIQCQTICSPDQRIYHAPGPYHSFRPYRSPLGMASHLPLHQGTPSGAWNESGGPASYSFSSNVSTGGNFPSPGSGQVGTPDLGRGGSHIPNPGRGRDHWFGNVSPGSGRGGSPSSNPGRGRDHQFGSNTSPGSGRSGGRGHGFHDHVSALDRLDKFYSKSMVEDPWKCLEPVLWSREDTEVKNLNDWLPKSVSMKKPKVSEPHSQSNPQFNLAEYLAASLNEAVEASENA